MENNTTTNQENAPLPEVVKYPVIQEILSQATQSAFKTGEHWANVPEPKGQAVYEDFYKRLELAVDKEIDKRV